MASARLGAVIRALRRRRRWRQLDLARAASVSQSTISLIEREHYERLAVHVLARVTAALDARLKVEITWRAGDLDRLLDERHARLSSAVVHTLQGWGWDVRTEITYSSFGERGSIDILAWHPSTRTLLVVEIKTELVSAEATLRKLDEKERLSAAEALRRYGWRPLQIGILLVVPESQTDRRRAGRHGPLFSAALPARGFAIRRWLRAPAGTIRGLWFIAPPDARSGTRGHGHGRDSPSRVRLRYRRAASSPLQTSKIRPC